MADRQLSMWASSAVLGQMLKQASQPETARVHRLERLQMPAELQMPVVMKVAWTALATGR
jgi:hypothetical protein